MLRAKQTDTRNILVLILFCVLFLLPRVIFLDRDEINPDGVNWHFRSEQFIVALKSRDFVRTYQYYHPGVTLMWVVGTVGEVIKQLSPDYGVYDQFSFPIFHFYSKLALVGLQLILSLLALFLLSKIIGKRFALFSILLLSVEPFFLGNSRLLHMDTLLTMFLFNGLLFSYLNIKKYTAVNSLLAGLFMALSFLTKSIAIAGLAFVLVTNFLGRISLRTFFKSSALTLFSFIFFTFLLFPALWVEPVKTVSAIFSEAERIGMREGHNQILFGEFKQDAGFLFYPIVLLMKLSPITILGVFVFVASVVGEFVKDRTCPFKPMRNLNIFAYLGIFYVGYSLFMILASKKLDRYMLVIYPFLCILSVIGLDKLFRLMKSKISKIVFLAVLIIGLGYPLFSYFPYYFTYTSPVFGSAENANKVIAQKPFGIGMFELKNLILENYDEPVIGFYDTKPLKAIYPNSKILDVRVSGPGMYDVLVLGPNEEIPEEVAEDGHVFEKEHSLYINGLEYWRVYAKKI